MPYRPRKTTHSTALKTALAAKVSTGAWVHDAETGETFYSANPDRYLDLDLATKGKPRFKVLIGKRNPSARNEIKRKPKRPKPTLYPMAGGDPLAGPKRSTNRLVAVLTMDLTTADLLNTERERFNKPIDRQGFYWKSKMLKNRGKW